MFLPDVHGVYPLFPFSREHVMSPLQSKLKDLDLCSWAASRPPLGKPSCPLFRPHVPNLPLPPLTLSCALDCRPGLCIQGDSVSVREAPAIGFPSPG